MVSILADSNEQFMAKEQYIKLSWGQLGAALVFIGTAFWGVSSLINEQTQGRLLSIDTSISQNNIHLGRHGELLAGIDERMKSLDRRVEVLEKPHYESKAKAAGFKSPQIVPTNLVAQEKFDSKSTKADGGQRFMRYTILGYDSNRETLTFRVDEIVRGDDGKEHPGRSRDNVLVLPVKIGEQVRFTGMFGELSQPTIFVQVLDRPSSNRAVLAIGEKVAPEGKTS